MTIIREFIFGNNQTGLVTDVSARTVTVVGGEVSSLGDEIMTGQVVVYYGKAMAAPGYVYPSATIEAWDAYMSTATATGTSRASAIRTTKYAVTSRWFSLGIALTIAFELVW